MGTTRYNPRLYTYDFQAGGKALYEAFHARMGIPVGRYKPWDKRTAGDQAKWAGMLKDAIKAASEAKNAKEAR